jgi:trehalose-phosphatase
VIDIMSVVRRIAHGHEGVVVVKGKKVLELRPDLSINKGTAVQRLIDHAKSLWGCDPFPLYAGDDTTDEDAFAAIEQGVTILVGEDERQTCATHRIHGPAELVLFMTHLEAARRAYLRSPLAAGIGSGAQNH